MKAHSSLAYIRPDEVAECWDGVTAIDGLYRALWDCVPLYKAPSPEVSEEPCYGMDGVADFWDRFSDDHKAALNDLAEANDSAYEDDGQPDWAQEWHDFDPEC
jgi:hypothetical protein